jgi:hypothetical protein
MIMAANHRLCISIGKLVMKKVSSLLSDDIHFKKGQKVNGSAHAYQDFKRIFKSIWEESVVLTEEKNQISKSMTWDEAMDASQFVNYSPQSHAASQFVQQCNTNDVQLLQEFLQSKGSQLSPGLFTALQQQLNRPT